MGRNISLSINVSKIDKSLLYQGKTGKFLNVVLIETPGHEYGDYRAVQDMPKERREAGDRGEILGNGKFFGKEEAPQQQRGGNQGRSGPPQQVPSFRKQAEDDETIPF